MLQSATPPTDPYATTYIGYTHVRGHSRAGGNPVPLPVPLDARFRGHDAGELCNVTKELDH